MIDLSQITPNAPIARRAKCGRTFAWLPEGHDMKDHYDGCQGQLIPLARLP